MKKIIIEVTRVSPRIYFDHKLTIHEIKPSCNGHYDIQIGGTGSNLIKFLTSEFYDMSMTDVQELYPQLFKSAN